MLTRVSLHTATIGVPGTLRHLATSFPSRELCWPDADPLLLSSKGCTNKHQTALLADDVSGTHATSVYEFCSPRCAADVQDAVRRAGRGGRTVCMRGTQHSMGGHSISPGGIVIDLKHFADVTVSEDRSTVTCGPGAMWMDLIRVLNPYGKSPVSMQSYCSFSVGGTLSVNGHGITSDFCVAHSVVEMDVVLPDGSVQKCTRGCKDTGELFSLILGGYGMFGIIVSVTMKVAENYALSAESFPVCAHDFPFVYKGALKESEGPDGDIAVKLARMDITAPDRINMYIFRKKPFSPISGSNGPPSGVVGDLDSKDEGMGTIKRLLYKWLAPPLQEIRYQLETQYGAALDWEEAYDKNSLMYQTARPLAQLSEPVFMADDTFILQEYFIPQDRFASFIAQIKPIYSDIISAGSAGVALSSVEGVCPAHVHLLNTTIRFVHKDTDTALPYSQSDQGSFAFVLYYRLGRNKQSLATLESYHHRLTEVALSMGGTFFLPYQHHYTESHLLKAYPMFEEFIAKKVQFDPNGIFDSCWFRRYGLPRTPVEYQAIFTSRDARIASALESYPRYTIDDYSTITAEEAEKSNNTTAIPDFVVISSLQAPPITTERRTDSFHQLMKNTSMRCAFRDKFLKHVFEVAQTAHLFGVMSRLQYDVRYSTDAQIYAALSKALEGETSGPGHIMREFRKLLQASRQKSQLAKETHRLVSKLGLIGRLKGYVSIGDYGRMILPFHEVLHLKEGGDIYVVHDDAGDAYSLGAAVERGCADPLGTFARIDYKECLFPSVPSGCCDLVTMNQGLHHLPQDKIRTFLSEVVRVLRPGGIFLVREHDATPDLIPMLDMAHFIFNCVMGVSTEEEESEVRAFRPIEQWRKVITGLTDGFLVDTQVYELQETDPTLDIMMSFRKKGRQSPADATLLSNTGSDVEKDMDTSSASAPPHHRQEGGSLEKELIKAHPFYKSYMEFPKQFQSFTVSGLKDTAGLVDDVAEALGGMLSPAGHEDTLVVLIKEVLHPWKSVLEKLQVMLANTTPRSPHLYDAVPIEIFVVFRLLEKKVKDKKATAQETLVVAAIHQLVKTVIMPTPIGIDDDVYESTTPSARTPTSSSSTPRRSPSASSKASLAEEVAELSTPLLEAMPHLLQRSYLQDHAGVPSPIVDTLQGLLPGGLAIPTPRDHRRLAAALSKRFTTGTLEDMKKAILDLIASKTTFTFDALLSRGADLDGYVKSQRSSSPASPPDALPLSNGINGWSVLGLAVLGDPHVSLTRTVTIAARFYGFYDVVQVHEKAQALRQHRWGTNDDAMVSGECDGSETSIWADTAEKEVVAKALRELEGEQLFLEMSASTLKDLEGVASLLNVTYRGKDVTTIARLELFDLSTNTVRFKGIDLDATFKVSSFWALLYEKLISYVSKKGVDNGDRLVKITYRSSEVNTSSLRSLASPEAVLEYVPRRSLLAQSTSPTVRGVGTQNDKVEATLFKFAEWMQVHILEELSSSLHHTPWYRYPFMSTMRQYLSVVKQISSRVRQEKNVTTAYASKYSLTASIPGVVMGVLFGQMQLLALPLRRIAGDSYDANRLRQRVLVYVPQDAMSGPLRNAYSGEFVASEEEYSKVPGGRVWPVRSFEKHGATVSCTSSAAPHMYTITAPPFSALTSTLVEMLQYNNQIIPISIEGHTRVNVHLRVNNLHQQQIMATSRRHMNEEDKDINNTDDPMDVVFTALLKVADVSGGEIVVDPFVLGSTANASLLIPVSNLGRLVRVCSTAATTSTPSSPKVSIVAIYDFY